MGHNPFQIYGTYVRRVAPSRQMSLLSIKVFVLEGRILVHYTIIIQDVTIGGY
jgi:hypothetical protein